MVKTVLYIVILHVITVIDMGIIKKLSVGGVL